MFPIDGSDQFELLARFNKLKNPGLTLDIGRKQNAPDRCRIEAQNNLCDDDGIQHFAELLHAYNVRLRQHQFKIRLKERVVDGWHRIPSIVHRVDCISTRREAERCRVHVFDEFLHRWVAGAFRFPRLRYAPCGLN